MGKKRRRISNKSIVIIKMLTAIAIFFSCCLYLFDNFELLKNSIGLNPKSPLGSVSNPWINVLFPIIYIFGVCFIIYYITNMVVRFEAKELWKADRLFIGYHIVYFLLTTVLICRWYLENNGTAFIPTMVMMVAGITNLFTPQIIDNDNDEF